MVIIIIFNAIGQIFSFTVQGVAERNKCCGSLYCETFFRVYIYIDVLILIETDLNMEIPMYQSTESTRLDSNDRYERLYLSISNTL